MGRWRAREIGDDKMKLGLGLLGGRSFEGPIRDGRG